MISSETYDSIDAFRIMKCVYKIAIPGIHWRECRPLFQAGYSTREEIIDGITTGKFTPTKQRNFGFKSYFRICELLGIDGNLYLPASNAPRKKELLRAGYKVSYWLHGTATEGYNDKGHAPIEIGG